MAPAELTADDRAALAFGDLGDGDRPRREHLRMARFFLQEAAGRLRRGGFTAAAERAIELAASLPHERTLDG